MFDRNKGMIGMIFNQGQHVPVVAFYSVSGGVGKSTLARKFAELVTQAPGRGGHKPNVLLIDLDVESSGLTFRLTKGLLRRGDKTVHEVFAEQNINFARAIPLSGVASGGQLFLMPAAPPEAKGLFDTIARIPKDELLKLLLDMINSLVGGHDISCVVIDCAPGSNPYTAAAAAIADIPFLIGRNEQTTYDQIQVLPRRFQEYYEQFNPALQKVIVNAVGSQYTYKERAERHTIFDFIPLTTDVILETEGLSMVGSLRMLLFEKYIVDIIRQVFVAMGKEYLVPKAPDIVGQEWIEILNKLSRCDEAPKIKRLWSFRHLRWIGIVAVVIGIALIIGREVLSGWSTSITSTAITNIGILCILIGAAASVAGWYMVSERTRILAAARELVLGGAEMIIEKIKAGASHRKVLDEMKKLAETIPEKSNVIHQS